MVYTAPWSLLALPDASTLVTAVLPSVAVRVPVPPCTDANRSRRDEVALAGTVSLNPESVSGVVWRIPASTFVAAVVGVPSDQVKRNGRELSPATLPCSSGVAAFAGKTCARSPIAVPPVFRSEGCRVVEPSVPQIAQSLDPNAVRSWGLGKADPLPLKPW